MGTRTEINRHFNVVMGSRINEINSSCLNTFAFVIEKYPHLKPRYEPYPLCEVVFIAPGTNPELYFKSVLDMGLEVVDNIVSEISRRYSSVG